MTTAALYLLLVFNPGGQFVAFEGFFKASDCEYAAAVISRKKPHYRAYCKRVDV